MSDTESVIDLVEGSPRQSKKAKKAPSAASQEKKYSNWVCVIHFADDDELQREMTRVEAEEALEEIKPKCAYWIVGEEMGNSKESPHFQCYFQFKTAQRYSTLRRLVRCYWKEQYEKSSPEEAADYCKKEGKWSEGGEMRGTQKKKEEGRALGGQRTKDKWAHTMECIKSGRVDEIDPQIFICHYHAIMAMAKRYIPLPKELDWIRPHTPNRWYYGPAGTGKSYGAREYLKSLAKKDTGVPFSVYTKNANKWWDGYDEEVCQGLVIIEEWGKPHECLLYFLKIWGDRFPFLAEVKGSGQGLRPKVIIITSNYHPREIWPNDQELQPVLDRFEVTQFGALGMGRNSSRTDTLPLSSSTAQPSQGRTSEEEEEEEEEVLFNAPPIH